MSSITLKKFLNSQTELFAGLPARSVKLVRHKDSREEYREMIKYRDGLLEYQRIQRKPVFKNCKHLISFVGGERRRSILFGVFNVLDVRQIGEEKYYYDLEEEHSLSYLNNRVVIDWGASALAWHQWYDNEEKEIIEILPSGFLGSFPGLLNFSLDFEELQKLFSHPEANVDWRNHLSAVNGIYLILDTNTGLQYIGSANGQFGIWQRWSDYAKTCHGGNRELIALIKDDPNYYRHFRFSVLQSLPSNVTQKEIVQLEGLYKQKLGSRVHGLNAN